jgi:hypothetical protein
MLIAVDRALLMNIVEVKPYIWPGSSSEAMPRIIFNVWVCGTACATRFVYVSIPNVFVHLGLKQVVPLCPSSKLVQFPFVPDVCYFLLN